MNKTNGFKLPVYAPNANEWGRWAIVDVGIHVTCPSRNVTHALSNHEPGICMPCETSCQVVPLQQTNAVSTLVILADEFQNCL